MHYLPLPNVYVFNLIPTILQTFSYFYILLLLLNSSCKKDCCFGRVAMLMAVNM